MPPAFRFVALGVFAISALTAQRTGAPGKQPGVSAPSISTPAPASPGTQDPWPGSQLPIMFIGAVVIEGGGGPASNVAVQRVCGTIPHTVAWTNAKGQFSFQWNDSNDVLPDASEPGPHNPGSSDRSSISTAASGGPPNASRLPGSSVRGCELQVNAPGFTSDRLDLSQHRALDNPDLGNIVLHRVSRAEAASVSATTLYAPKDARKAWERGMQLLRSDQQSDTAVAEREFEKAVRIYPKYADAWLGLGRARQRRQMEDGAREAFLKAVESDSRLVEAIIELGMIASHRHQWPEAAQYLDRALQLNPVNYPHLWFDDAEANFHSGNLDRAEKNVREALKIPPPNREPEAMRLLSLVLVSKQQYAGAEVALLTYMRESPDFQDWDQLQATLEEIRAHLPAKQ